jgi:hypothetical protein
VSVDQADVLAAQERDLAAGVAALAKMARSEGAGIELILSTLPREAPPLAIAWLASSATTLPLPSV